MCVPFWFRCVCMKQTCWRDGEPYSVWRVTCVREEQIKMRVWLHASHDQTEERKEWRLIEYSALYFQSIICECCECARLQCSAGKVLTTWKTGVFCFLVTINNQSVFGMWVGKNKHIKISEDAKLRKKKNKKHKNKQRKQISMIYGTCVSKKKKITQHSPSHRTDRHCDALEKPWRVCEEEKQRKV